MMNDELLCCLLRSCARLEPAELDLLLATARKLKEKAKAAPSPCIDDSEETENEFE
jgi:hypothetical protein